MTEEILSFEEYKKKYQYEKVSDLLAYEVYVAIKKVDNILLTLKEK